jgi:L-ascorbate metabolism protein UlaG (beta-lactamase superfamily)
MLTLSCSLVQAKTSITWLGQAATLIETDEGKKILIDPFIFNNPKTPKKFKNEDLYKNIDLILITHGHGDHLGDYKKILSLSPKSKIIMNADMGNVLISQKQFSKERFHPLNKSGEVSPLGKAVKVIMVRAEHSSSVKINEKIHYGGEPVGYVLEFSDGKKLYHAGDTGVFQDMKLIGDYYKIDLALVPIGGNYTMGPKEAAFAINNLLKPKKVIPIHYGTFPILTGIPEEFKKELKDKTPLLILEPGDETKL